MSATLKTCVIGHPVAHSRSPLLHGYWLKTLGVSGSYELADVAPEKFSDFLQNLRAKGFVGGNVTVPHKEAAFRAVTRRAPAAEAIGAVNTVWYEGDDLVGDNTDTYGFLTHFDATVPGWERTARHALVLGSGGAARAVTHGLLTRGMQVTLANRTIERARDLSLHFDLRPEVQPFAELDAVLPGIDILINTTPLGMAGKPALEIKFEAVKREAIIYDIVYVPLQTGLLRMAKARDHRTVDGLGMLLHQAVPAFARWFGVTPEVTSQLRALIEADIVANS